MRRTEKEMRSALHLTVIVVVGHVESSVLFLLLAAIRDAEQPTDAVIEVGH